ncbi:DnaT-like ssDNA-binding protein [Kaistia adipata]|uniref:DnaT-like ssDNA-binding protein n=1 Tax=Kaistia adipata TaxID=166954 RepID=UPI000418F4A5|nr:DnaT-like ssDNA-binding protein [Kaistia adipata]
MANYGDLPAALAYHTARLNAAWSATGVTDDQRAAALVRASAVLDGRYGIRYPGRKAGGRRQALGWPRIEAEDTAGEAIAADEIPTEILNAAFEMALAELTSPGSLSPSVTPGQVKVRARVEGAVDVTYAGGGSVASQRPTLTIVDDILTGLLSRSSGASVDLLRV